MTVEIVRSKRKTLSMELRHGVLTVRAPRWVSRREIDAFVASHRDWAQRAAAREAEREAQLASVPKLTQEELAELTARARAYLPQRVAYYAPLVGVSYEAVTVRRQRTRWGSCSAKGNLSFNCLLMLTPPEVIDSVVAHELCHRLEMNHSPRFYAHLLRVFPDYPAQHRWLREHAQTLLARLPG